ncbi:MAG: hypothetical protein ACRDTG_16185 [Pseudonocardiaceae bacterium]
MRDVVQVHITAALPIRVQALGFADRIEVRFGKAFPVVLIVDRDAVAPLAEAIEIGRVALFASRKAPNEESGDHDG